MIARRAVYGALALPLVVLMAGLAGCPLGGGDNPPPDPTTGSAAITVNDGTNPIPGASVTLDADTKTTDVAGKVTFNEIPGGTYSVTVTKSSYARHSENLTVASGETALLTVSLELGGSAAVTVEDGSGPLSGADVSLGGRTLSTDASGVASFTDLAAGNYTATSVKNGYSSGNALVTVVAGSTVAATISLTRQTGSAAITVKDGADALVGASVTLNLQTLTTDASGLVTFRNVPIGPYMVAVSATAYRVNSASINVTKDATVSATISLTRQKGDVVVRVAQNPSNQPVLGATVKLDGTALTAVTDGNGYAEFRDVPIGAYTLRVSMPVYQEKTASVTVVDYGSAQCELLLDRWVGKVALQALKANGSPLAGAKVDMYYPAVDRMPTSPTKDAHGFTDATGLFVIDGVVNGTWWAVVAPQVDPYGPAIGTIVTVNESTVTVTVQSQWWN